jgi:hypothetical protein
MWTIEGEMRFLRQVITGDRNHGWRNEIRGNDFRDADMYEVDFRDIDLDAQLLPVSAEYIRIRDFPTAVEMSKAG